MYGLSVLTSNYLINVAFVSWASAQILKTIFTFVFTKKFVAERLFGAGGMPSAHSALVCSLAVAMAKKEGFSSPMFALALCFAGVVMYDAMGVRRAAGEQAKVLNSVISGLFENKPAFGDFPKLEEYFSKLTNKKLLHFKSRENDVLPPEDGQTTDVETDNMMLNEFLGHTPLEVIGGALLGILISMLMPVQ
ncbi:MAG: divergent PAP2 family protein [Oscillospiraceae bacterium]